MYGDPAAVRAEAQTLRRLAQQTRFTADRLVAATEATTWTGLAADRLHDHVRERAARLRATAGLEEEAAGALERHACAAGLTQDLIAAAQARITRAVHDAPGAARDALGHLVLPAHGSVDWLDVRLPGLGG